MSDGLSAEERIAQLQARGQAQRLAAQLAVIETREQFAPLRSAAGVIGMAARALSSRGTAASAIGALARFGLGHPWAGSALVGAAAALLRRRPLAVLLAGAAGVAAWWLMRPGTKASDAPRDGAA